MSQTQPPTILTIDDEGAIRTSIRNYLEDYNYVVAEAENGLEGLKLIESEKPDLVMVDLRMPEVNGLEVLKKTTAAHPETPIIVVSGTGSISDVIEALHLGAWDYILKPIQDLSVMLHAVEKNLERARLRKENRDHQLHLEREVAKRTAELRANEATLHVLLDAEDNTALLMDLEGTILAINTTGRTHLARNGQKDESLLGTNLFTLLDENLAKMRHQMLQDAMEQGKPVTLDEAIGDRFYETTVYPVRDVADQITRMALFARDMTDRIKAEQRREQDLREKEMLLKEIHHRVKNNLQVICSLLSLQSRHIEDQNALAMFTESRDRVRSMALVHELLYGSNDLSHIDFSEYIQRLSATLFKAYAIPKKNIKLEVAVGDVPLGVDLAIPCGLIINELISNALKHAFPDPLTQQGLIEIKMDIVDKQEVVLQVRDNGVGLPQELDIRNNDSLGMHLITLLAEDQLSGKIDLDRENGTAYTIRFKTGRKH